MDKQEASVFLKCDCGLFSACINYSITVQGSHYDHKHATLLGWIKSAVKILFGKPIYYSDVYIDNPEEFRKFVEELDELRIKEIELAALLSARSLSRQKKYPWQIMIGQSAYIRKL